MSIGFSPPRHACQRSGFAARTSTNARYAAMNSASTLTMYFQWRFASPTSQRLR